MSCRNRLTKFLSHCLAKTSSSATVAELEQIQRDACVLPRSSAERIANEAKVRALFKEFDKAGIKRPTHNLSGMPGSDTICAGYAKLYDELRERGLIGSTSEVELSAFRERMRSLININPTLLNVANRACDFTAGSAAVEFMKRLVNRELAAGGYPDNLEIADLISKARLTPFAPKDEHLETLVRYAQEVCILAETPRCSQCGQWIGSSHDCPNTFDENGYNRYGRNRFGRDKEGFDLYGRDWEGFDREGYDKDGFNRRGFTRYGFDRSGAHMTGYRDVPGQRYPVDSDGYDVRGFKNHVDRDGYDDLGLKNGRDRNGYDLNGKDQYGRPHPDWKPDERGFYPDGLDEDGYDAEGYNVEGYNRWGLNRQGYDEDGYSLDGYNKNGFNRKGKSRDGFDDYTYRDNQGRDVSGYDWEGFKDGYTCTGYDRDGLDREGKPRMTRDKKGKLVEVKYNKWGIDKEGYTRWGFHHQTGLSEPDAQGKQYDIHGWEYDSSSDRLVNPANRDAWRPYEPVHLYSFIRDRNGYSRVVSLKAPHPMLGVTITPPTVDPLSTPPGGPRSQIWKSSQRWEKRGRAVFDPLASEYGIRLRCSRCGRFTNVRSHNCPAFDGEWVVEWSSGAVTTDNVLPSVSDILFSTIRPEYDGRYRFNGYDKYGYDPDGYDMRGYRRDGRNRLDRDPEGYDPLGYDIEGYKRDGLDREGKDRDGNYPRASLQKASQLLNADEELLNNEMMAEYFGVVASAATGRPCRVVLQEGGFATDMKGTIYADPYPLGRDADPRHNLVVTKAGIYHEIGHELYTDPEHWAYILGVTKGEIEAEGIDKGKHLVSRMYNIIEDGRMEREVSKMPGVAATLAASCAISPRWEEKVGADVPLGHQIQGALLYTALPYFYVKSELVEAMTPEARALFKELEPIVRSGVLGSQEDALKATLEIVRRLEANGVFDQDPDLQVSPPSPPPANTNAKGPQDEQGGSQGEQGGSQGAQASQAEEDDGVDGRKNRPRKAEEDDGVDGRKNRPRKAEEDDGVDGRKNRPRKAEEDDGVDGRKNRPRKAEEDDGVDGRKNRPRKEEEDTSPNANEKSSEGAGEQRGGGEPQPGAGGESSEGTSEQRGDGEPQPGAGGESSEGTSEQRGGGWSQPTGEESSEGTGEQRGGGWSHPNAKEGSSEKAGEQRGGGELQPGAGGENSKEASEQRGVEQRGQSREGGGPQDSSDGYQAHDINAKKEEVERGETQVHDYRPPPKDMQVDLAPVLQPGELDKILTRAEQEAAAYLTSGIRKRSTFEVLGKALHQPLPKEFGVVQRYRDPDKNVNSIPVQLSSTDNPSVLSALEARMPEIRAVAGQLTRYIRFIRDSTEERLRNQTRGRLDRRRLVAAMKGSDAVRTRKEELPETSMVVSVLLDMSGSMGHEISSGRLHDATMVLATTFEGLDMPYEVRGHGSSATQYKSMGDPIFDPQRSAMLTIDNLRGNECSAPVMALSTNALVARPEANKLMISLTDGQLNDHDATVRQLETARENGVVTFGVYLGTPDKDDEGRLDALYGPGNWAVITGLAELPDKVGKRLVEYFKLLG